MRLFHLLLASTLVSITFNAAKAFQVDSLPWNNYNSLTAGIVHEVTLERTENDQRPAALGFTAQMSTSFILSWLAPQRNNRLKIGDLFSGELLAGLRYPRPHTVWEAYRFTLGLTTGYSFSQGFEGGAKLVPLIFAHDQLTPNISGSSFSLWTRFKRIHLSAGAEARHDRFDGFLKIPASRETPKQYAVSVEYILPKKRIAGINLLWGPNTGLSLNRPAYSPGLPLNRFMALNLFYGITF